MVRAINITIAMTIITNRVISSGLGFFGCVRTCGHRSSGSWGEKGAVGTKTVVTMGKGWML